MLRLIVKCVFFLLFHFRLSFKYRLYPRIYNCYSTNLLSLSRTLSLARRYEDKLLSVKVFFSRFNRRDAYKKLLQRY